MEEAWGFGFRVGAVVDKVEGLEEEDGRLGSGANVSTTVI